MFSPVVPGVRCTALADGWLLMRFTSERSEGIPEADVVSEVSQEVIAVLALVPHSRAGAPWGYTRCGVVHIVGSYYTSYESGVGQQAGSIVV